MERTDTFSAKKCIHKHLKTSFQPLQQYQMVLVPEHVAGSKIITINQDSIAEETFFLFHALYVIASHCISPNGIVDCTYFRKFMKDDGSLENIPAMKINNNNSEDCDNFDTSLNGGLTVSSSTIIFSFLKRVREEASTEALSAKRTFFNPNSTIRLDGAGKACWDYILRGFAFLFLR